MVQTWQTVRVFISSTFRDMHAERDWLVKVVFPELRERMAKRNLYLVDVDLRWGVTEEEAKHGKALEVCLEEIEHCRPFFIGILGERYGSISSTVPEDTEFTYPWLTEYKGHSLTALEIIHGVLRKPELMQRAYFYFRDPQVIEQIPKNQSANYSSENPESTKKLAALKEKIRASGRPVTENYPCRWDDKQKQIVNLDTFGQQVLEDLWSAICATYPEQAPEADPITIERQMHEAFADEHSRLHIGRERQLEVLTKYVQGKDRRPVVVTGESGCGKSSFLANWCKQYNAKHPDDFILVYFIGACPDSTNHFRLLRIMCQELKRQFNLKEEIPEDDKKLSETLAIILSSVSKNKERIIIVLDALDQLLPLEAAHGLGWLLDYMPEKVRLVVSALSGDCLDVLRRREVEEIVLPLLDEKEQRQIIQVLLSEWRRKLDDEQMLALLVHPGVKNPLYLRVALEELRLFGKFDELPGHIRSLAKDIPGLFLQVLKRLEEDHGEELVSEAFSLISCSRYGLSETELLQLLLREGEEQFPRVLWARLYRIAKIYLVQRGELISFFHRQLAEAVALHYLERKKTHAKLASFFEKAPIERKLDEYPYQLQQAEEWDTLAKALSDLDFFEYAWGHDREYEWIAYWRSLEGKYNPGKCYNEAVRIRLDKKEGIEDIARLSHNIGLLLHDIGLDSAALVFTENALVIRANVLGSNHPDVAQSLSNLAMFYDYQGMNAKAQSFIESALIVQRDVFGSNHPDVADSLNKHALLCWRNGENDKALYLCLDGLSIREHVLGPDHTDIAYSLYTLGMIYQAQNKFNDALTQYQRALAIFEHALGPYHPDVANTINNMAILYDDHGDLNMALAMHVRAQTIKERTLGPNHPDVAINLINEASIYESQGMFNKALPLYQRALDINVHAPEPNIATIKECQKLIKDCEEAIRKRS